MNGVGRLPALLRGCGLEHAQVNVGHRASFEVGGGGGKLTVLKAEPSNSLLKDLGKEKTTFTKVIKWIT